MERSTRRKGGGRILRSTVVALASFGAASLACGSENSSTFTDEDAGSTSSTPGAPDTPSFGDATAPSTEPGCNSIRGKVYDPAGKTPLYGVTVYVPNGDPPPLGEGVSCDRCGTPVSALAVALTDSSGAFTLTGVPDGATRLVMETGKWRREVTITGAKGCKETVVDDPALMHLPRNASEGTLPHVAVVTGSADNLECLLRKIGISDSEFGTAGDAATHVHLYHGINGRSTFATGAAFAASSVLYEDSARLDTYDAVLASCAGQVEDKRTTKLTWVAAMEAYAAKGGRAFFSHYMNFFVGGGSAKLASAATIIPGPGNDLVDPFVADVNTTFPKGKAFDEWLGNVGASTPPDGLSIHSAQRTVAGVSSAVATPWIQSSAARLPDGSTLGNAVEYFTIGMPAGQPATNQCGKYVVSDIHVSSDSSQQGGFPTGCSTKELMPQEKALEFMLFDLSSCVRADSEPPTPPPIR